MKSAKHLLEIHIAETSETFVLADAGHRFEVRRYYGITFVLIESFGKFDDALISTQRLALEALVKIKTVRMRYL